MPIQKIMDPVEGHSEHQVDINDIMSLAAAHTRFKLLTRRGFSVVEPGQNGQPARRLDKFDPTVEETIFIPRLKGG